MMTVEDLTKALWMLNGEELGAVSAIYDGKIYMADGRIAFVDMLAELYDKAYSNVTNNV